MRIAVLGTGIMGAAMARNLARDGHEVRAWNRSPEKAEPLSADGIAVAHAPEDAARGAEVLVTMLLDADATVGPAAAALGVLAPGAVWWQAGTVGVPGAGRLAGLAAGAGVEFVDGPVLGTRAPAEAGQLTVVAAGGDDALDRLTPVFGATVAREVAAQVRCIIGQGTGAVDMTATAAEFATAGGPVQPTPRSTSVAQKCPTVRPDRPTAAAIAMSTSPSAVMRSLP